MKAQRTTVALVISTYNWPEALDLVLKSLLDQTKLPDEVFIADDGSSEETEALICTYRPFFPIPIRHFWQEDRGFRKSSIINQTIGHCSADYIIQIDGDMVLNQHFIEDHLYAMEPGYYIRGSRVLLDERISRKWILHRTIATISPLHSGISNRLNAIRSKWLSKRLVKKSRRSDNVHGSNMAYWRSDFVKVNGYNNRMEGWGHEDIELAARFINFGLSQKKLKALANAYHLYHQYNTRDRAAINYSIYEKTVADGITYCADGYDQSLQPCLPINWETIFGEGDSKIVMDNSNNYLNFT